MSQNLDNIINKVYKPSQINLKSFEYKKSLNPKIWIDNKLNPKVRTQLIKIAKEFIKSTDIKFIPVDIIIVGSIASYNWSKYSDIDLHIYCDFSTINNDKELIKKYFDSKKNDWNNTHGDITIYGYDVELYVQDINEVNASNGVYSVKNNYWIKFPTYQHMQLKKDDIKQLAVNYIKKIDYYVNKFEDIDNIKQFLLLKSKCDYLYQLIKDGRKTSLEKEGEQATENIVFKVLRRSGHLQLLWNLRNKIFDKINSIDESAYITELPTGLLTESLNEMARPAVQRTIDRKLWLSVSSTLSRNKSTQGEFIKPRGNNKEDLLQRYVAALLIQKKDMPKNVSEIEDLKTFKLIGLKFIELGGTIKEIQDLYLQNKGNNTLTNNTTEILQEKEFDINVKFQYYHRIKGTTTVDEKNETIKGTNIGNIEEVMTNAFDKYIIKPNCYRFLRQYRGSDPEYSGPGEWAVITVTDKNTGEEIKIEDINGKTRDKLFDESKTVNYINPEGLSKYKVKCNDIYRELHGVKKKVVQPVKRDIWHIKYTDSDGDCSTVWYEATDKLDAISQFRDDYYNKKILMVYKK